MGVLDKFKNLVGIGDEYDDEDEYITEEEVEEAERQLEREKAESNRFASSSRYNSPSRESNIIAMGNKMSSMGMNVVIMEPKVLDEAQELVDSLKEDKPIIINLNSSSPENGRKIFDFLSGATYALNGSVQKIEDNIFIFAPNNISVSDRTEKSEGEKGGLGFSDIDNFLGGK